MMLYYKDLAVVGFNATARGDCGYAVAIARHNPTRKYIRLSFPEAELELARGLRRPGENVPPGTEAYTPKGHLLVNDESDIKAFQNEELVTLFREGLEFPAFQNVMVLHVAQPLLDSAGVGLRSTRLDWKLLSEVPHKVWVTCATVDSIFLLMDDWGWALMDKCIDHLTGYFSSDETDKSLLAKAEQSVEFALGAARDDALREELLLLYGVTATFSRVPRQVDDVFEMDLLPEFKEKKWRRPDDEEKKWTWPEFDQQLGRLIETLRNRAKARTPIAGGGTHEGELAEADARPLVKRILMRPLQVPELLLDRVETAAREIEREKSLPEKLAKAVKVAEFCRRLFPPDEVAAREITNELKRDDYDIGVIKIGTEARLSVFAADPWFYVLPGAVRVKTSDEVNFWDYLNWAIDYKSEYRKSCGQSLLAPYVLEQVEEIAPETFAASGRH